MRAVLAVMIPLWTLRCLGQGAVVFSNSGARDVVCNGLTGQPIPTGSTFKAALYYAPDGITDEAQFSQLGIPANFGPEPGYFSGGGRTAPTPTPGGFGMFQVRAWETAYGATYEQAVANITPQNGRLALAGETGIMRVDTESPFVGVPVPLAGGPPRIVAVTGTLLRDGFTLTVVPEPSTLFVFLATALGMLLFRRFR